MASKTYLYSENSLKYNYILIKSYNCNFLFKDGEYIECDDLISKINRIKDNFVRQLISDEIITELSDDHKITMREYFHYDEHHANIHLWIKETEKQYKARVKKIPDDKIEQLKWNVDRFNNRFNSLLTNKTKGKLDEINATEDELNFIKNTLDDLINKF